MAAKAPQATALLDVTYAGILALLFTVWGFMSALTDFSSDVFQWGCLLAATLAFGYLILRLITPLARTPAGICRLAATLLSIIVLVVSSGYYANLRFGGDGATPPVAIAAPAFLADVPPLVEVGGNAPELGPDESIWVLDGKISDPKVYLHGKPCEVTDQATGAWRCAPWPVGDPLNDPVGTAYRVFAVRTDKTAGDYFSQAWRDYDLAQKASDLQQSPEAKALADAAWSKVTYSADEPTKITNLPAGAVATPVPLVVQRQ